MLTVSVLIGLAAAGGTWLSLQPIVSAQLDELKHLTGASQTAARVEVTVALLGLLDAVLASVFTYLILSLLVGRPIRDAERNAAQILDRENLRHEDLKRFFSAFPKDAHPMAVAAAVVAALSTFYPNEVDPLG